MQSYLLASASTTDADKQTMIMIIIFMVIINIIIQLKQITRALVLFIGRQ